MLKDLLGKQDLEKAFIRIRPFTHRTPLHTSKAMDQWLGMHVLFKCENLQKVGAFKVRGAANFALQIHREERKYGLCTHSSGNHAQAVASIGKRLGMPVTVVMPENSIKVKIEAVKGYGAKVVFCEANHHSREEATQKIVEETNATFIPPFDHPWIIAGQATVSMEILKEIRDTEIIMAPVGGGGLLAGTCLGAKYFGNHVKVYGSEPEGASDAWEGMQKGIHITTVEANTIADGLRTPLGKLNYEIIGKECEGIFTVNDAEIIEAMKMVWERMKMVIEPSSAIVVAVLKKFSEEFKGKKCTAILTGGNVDLRNLPF